MASARKGVRAGTGFDWADAREHIGGVLTGPARNQILETLFRERDADGPFARLRRALRAHTLPVPAGSIDLRSIVDSLDARSRREGLHILHPWDFTTHERPDETAAVMLVDYCTQIGVPAETQRAALAILLDHYFLGVLSLFAVRAWDQGDANENLDAVTRLLGQLQGPEGSGHRFVDDAETLLLLAVSYYHPEERSYTELLGRVRMLDEAHQLRVALPCASIMSSHLRWGFRFMYGRDVGRMRADNVIDYPWLLFSILLPMRAWARMQGHGPRGAEQERVAEAALHGLAADPWAFLGKPPSVLTDHQAEHAELQALLARYRTDLLDAFARLKPSATAYAPLGLTCNFLWNAVVASVINALRPDPLPSVSLNALFTSRERDDVPRGSVERYARSLMRFALDPARRDARGTPLIVYDPFDGVQQYNTLVRAFRGVGGGPEDGAPLPAG